MIGFREHWFGKEIEGRFSDVETLFIAKISDNVPTDYKAPHVYVCASAVKELTEGNKWEDFLDDVVDKAGKIVTIEVKPGMLKKIPPMVRIRTHVLYMIEEEEVDLLTDNDSIKVVYGDYKLYITSIQNMQKVTPQDYIHDRIKE